MKVGRTWRHFIAITTVSTVTVLAPTGGYAQSSSPNFEFRGHKIGEPIEQNFPYWSQGYRGLDLPYCSKKEAHGVYECEDNTITVKKQYGTDKLVGDVPVLLLNYKFLDGKLVGLDMGFDFRSYSNIAGMLRGKYGKPSKEVNEKIQNRAGATFDSIISEWKFKEGTLRLHMRFARIDTSWLTFESPKAEAEIMRRKQGVDSEKGKKAF